MGKVNREAMFVGLEENAFVPSEDSCVRLTRQCSYPFTQLPSPCDHFSKTFSQPNLFNTKYILCDINTVAGLMDHIQALGRAKPPASKKLSLILKSGT